MTGSASALRLAAGLGRAGRIAVLLATLSGALPSDARAQFPAELSGRVLEAGTSEPIEDARVEAGSSGVAWTDASGSFVLRSADDGRVVVRVSRSGYADLERDIVLENGRVTVVTFALEPEPIEIGALEVVAEPRAGGGYVIPRAAIVDANARTLGELIRTVPGVVVSSSGTGERVSIRGSGADAVLVLVDGAPVNDPLTGEADLSLLALEDVESVRVIPGAHTARYGPRAEGGVVIIESRRSSDARAAASLVAGEYGERAVAADGAFEARRLGVSAGGRLAGRDDEFSYDRPDALGGGSASRANAGERTLAGFAGVELHPSGDAVRIRVDALDVERGLPGPMHALTPEARQDLTRASLAGGWSSVRGRTVLRLDASASWQRARFEDPAPAFGDAYFDTTHVREAGFRAEAEHVAGASLERTLAGGLELRSTELR